MIGTFINVGTILLGAIIGVSIGSRLSTKLRNTIVAGLGLFTFGYGLMTFIDTTNPMVPLGGLLIGALLGEWWKVEEGLEKVGFFLRSKFIRQDDEEGSDSRFVEGFVTASLVFVIGPIAILGSIQNGLTGNFEMLAIKAVLDGFRIHCLCILTGDRRGFFRPFHSGLSGRDHPTGWIFQPVFLGCHDE